MLEESTEEEHLTQIKIVHCKGIFQGWFPTRKPEYVKESIKDIY